MELKTDRLILRQARQGDLVDVNAFMANPDAMRFWSTPPHETIEHTRMWLQRNIEADAEVSANFFIEFEGRVDLPQDLRPRRSASLTASGR
jgi:[ribosomal protein S5]-alanine N-acetyltransferase